MKDTFIHHNHLCLVFELLSSNLYELIKQNSFRGLSTSLVRVFTNQLLDALTVLNEAHLIHCDLKPENILLTSLSISSPSLTHSLTHSSYCNILSKNTLLTLSHWLDITIGSHHRRSKSSTLDLRAMNVKLFTLTSSPGFIVPPKSSWVGIIHLPPPSLLFITHLEKYGMMANTLVPSLHF
jgi:serine/threonine protein kinase